LSVFAPEFKGGLVLPYSKQTGEPDSGGACSKTAAMAKKLREKTPIGERYPI